MNFKNAIFLLTAIVGIVSVTNAHADLKVFGYSNLVYAWQSATHPSFDQANTNLMMQHDTDKFKFFTEIEFQHSPLHEAESAGQPVTGRGAISVERAWAEIFLSKYAQIRTGVMLNTTLFVDNHFPSIVTTIDSPMLSKNIFEEQMEGAQLRGDLVAGFSYIAWVNRRLENAKTGAKDVGGHLYYENTLSDVWFKAGLLAAKYEKSNEAEPTLLNKQTAKGAELQLRIKGLNIWSEYATLEDKQDSTQNQRGFYTLLFYSIDTNSGEFIPFAMLDSYKGAHQDISFDREGNPIGRTQKNIVAKSFGLTYRPVPVISLKSEWTHTDANTLVDGTFIPKSNKIALAFVYFYN